MDYTDAEYIGQSRAQDTETINRLRQERQQQTLIITVVSPELHFDVAVGLCFEGTISEEVCDA